MREIKFRAWFNPNNQMIKSNYIYFDEFREIEDWFADEYYEFMQYTGLMDKNRKDIYEGDIVKLSKENRKLLGNIGIVKFKSGEFSIESPEFEHHDDIRLRKFYTHLEVIGNIYENPELLNKER
jgi:uncharacterized phage protein (TIGR01671 family)